MFTRSVVMVQSKVHFLSHRGIKFVRAFDSERQHSYSRMIPVAVIPPRQIIAVGALATSQGTICHDLATSTPRSRSGQDNAHGIDRTRVHLLDKGGARHAHHVALGQANRREHSQGGLDRLLLVPTLSAACCCLHLALMLAPCLR